MPSTSALARLLTVQLGGYARAHQDTTDLSRIRIVDSAQPRRKNISNASNVFLIVEKLPVYAGSCRTMARGEIRDLEQAGIILLLRSSSGLVLHVELSGAGKRLKVTRVSTGAIAKDLKRAIQRTSKQFTARSKGSELRILRVAGMHVSAVWVHRSKERGGDAFVPYTPNFAGLRLGRTYKLHRIESLLKKHATYMILRWYDRYEKSLAPLKSQRR